MNYWPSIVGTHPDNHVLHTFLSYIYKLSSPSLSPVTNLIIPTNDDPVLMNYTFGQPRNDFKTTLDVECSKIITPTVNIIVYDLPVL